MPELPDVVVYLDALRRRVLDQRIEASRLISPFVLRSVEPPFDAIDGKRIRKIDRIGKRIALSLEDDLHIVIHLMIAGRLRWLEPGKGGAKPGGRIGLATFAFGNGTLLLTEASKKKRASIHITPTHELRTHERDGLDVLSAQPDEIVERLRLRNHTVKRALTDPHLFDGIGNAYSDEVLHHAGLSPFKLTRSLSDEEAHCLAEAMPFVLRTWIDTLREQFDNGARFPGPGQITAFRPGFAVHGRFDEPCPVCSTPVQRVVFAENEMNYCPTCQTEGRLLADRSLSRLLKDDWPRTVEELENG